MQKEALILFQDAGGAGPPLRIAVAGVTTPEAWIYSPAGTFDGYAFDDLGPGEHSHAEVRESILRMLARQIESFDQQGDIVVVLSHLGGYETGPHPMHPDMITGKDIAGLPMNNLFILDGHSHNTIGPQEINGNWYMNCGDELRCFFELTVERWEDGRVKVTPGVRKYKYASKLTPDPWVESMVRDITERAAAKTPKPAAP